MPTVNDKKGRVKPKGRPPRSAAKFERLLKNPPTGLYRLSLYISGTSPRSVEAIAAIHSICDEYLEGQCELEVVDIYQQPNRAVENQIIAAPTLVKNLPLPVKKMIGNLSDRPRLVAGLGLPLPVKRSIKR